MQIVKQLVKVYEFYFEREPKRSLFISPESNAALPNQQFLPGHFFVPHHFHQQVQFTSPAV